MLSLRWFAVSVILYPFPDCFCRDANYVDSQVTDKSSIVPDFVYMYAASIFRPRWFSARLSPPTPQESFILGIALSCHQPSAFPPWNNQTRGT